MNNVRLIKRVEYCNINDIQSICYIETDKVRLQVSSPAVWTEFCIVPGGMEAFLKVSNKQESAGMVYKAELGFRTLLDKVPDLRRKVFKITMMDGSIRLIGKNDRPFTSHVVNQTYPKKVTDNMLADISIEWENRNPVPFVVE